MSLVYNKTKMKTEFEIVFREIDREKLIKIGAKCIKENTLMKRTVFQNPVNKENSYVRVRDEGDKITCTYKEILPGKLDINSIKEIETEVGNYDSMVNIFKKLGLKQKATQETYREIWSVENEVFFMIDIWPGLKPFLEIEGESEEVVKLYSEKLGFDYKKGLFGAVDQVYYEELGIPHNYINNLEVITFENPPKYNI